METQILSNTSSFEKTRYRLRLKPGFLIFVAAFFFLSGFFTGRCFAAEGTTVSKAYKPAVKLSSIVQTPPASASPVSTPPVSTPPASMPPDSTKNIADDWKLILINAQNPLPEGYAPELKSVGGNGHKFDARAAEALESMLKDAKAQGLSPIICSSYRTIEKQTTLYQNMVQKFKAQGYAGKDAEDRAATVVARPGTSEHNLGLAVDIVALSYQLLEEKQADTAESKWLRSNCHRYGFILRYPKDKQETTGVIYEPWHFRYVGTDAAKEIMEKGICLEEYLEQKKQ